jgi:hypothetical protein
MKHYPHETTESFVRGRTNQNHRNDAGDAALSTRAHLHPPSRDSAAFACYRRPIHEGRSFMARHERKIQPAID